MSSPHILLLMSHYTDPALSRRRLEIFQGTLAPSLSAQTRKPTLHVLLSPDDPCIAERMAALESTGCDWKPIYRNDWKLYGEDWELPEGHKVISRCDDDDVLRRNFAEVTYNCGMVARNRAIIWPNNYIYWRGTLFRWRHKGNQFVSLSTDRLVSPHYIQHSLIARRWRVVRASEDPGAIWVRHGDSESSTLKRYRKRGASQQEIDSVYDCFAVHLKDIEKAIAPSGKPSSSKRRHKKTTNRSMTISQWLTVCQSDKTSTHFYGSFYDLLFERIKPKRMLEIGVLGGASLRAWRHAGVPFVLGVDHDSAWQSRKNEGVMFGHMPDDAAAVLAACRKHGALDLIVDDGSHAYDDYTQTASVLLPGLREGGVYVIEDIQTEQDVSRLRESGWEIEDYRHLTGRRDDCIAWRERSPT